MNSPSYVDPKFPPSEEYSQGNYIPSHGAGDYYGAPAHHHPAAHPYAFGGAAAPPYGAENGGYVSSASPHYYQHSCSVTQTTLSPLSRPQALEHAGAGSHSPPYVGGPQPTVPLQRSPSPPPASAPMPRPSPQSPHVGPMHSPGGAVPASDCSQTGQPVIYPWMKKAHVNAGEHPLSSQGTQPPIATRLFGSAAARKVCCVPTTTERVRARRGGACRRDGV